MNLLIKSQYATPKISGENAHSQESAAQGAAVGAAVALDNPDLKTLINAWPALSDDDKHAILEIVNSGCKVAQDGTECQQKTT